MSARKPASRQIKRSQESEAEAKLQGEGYRRQVPKRDRGVPEGCRRFTCVLKVADNQLLHDWAGTVRGESFASVMRVALEEYIEKHVRKAVEAGLKVKRPHFESEEFEAALEAYPDFYEDAEAVNPYAQFL